MEPTESFAAAGDGTRLWWSTAGHGSPPIVLCDGIGCAGFIWRRLRPELAATRRVIHWNYRGHGKSERPRDPDRMSLHDCVRDLFAVLDAAGEESAILAGHSMGVQVCLEAHRLARHRVRALVLVCGAPGRPLDTFHGGRLLAQAFPRIKKLVDTYPGLARFTFRHVLPTGFALELGRFLETDYDRIRPEDLVPYLADLADVDPVLFVRLLESAAEHDSSGHLPQVDVPTLIVAGERDTFTPLSRSIRMHEAIPGSELLQLSRGSHVAPLEQHDVVALRMIRFLARVAPLSASQAAAFSPSGRGTG